MMIIARTLLVAHALAIAFGLAGILVALRHPELWAGSSMGDALFTFGMQHGAALHIVLGAAAVAAFSLATLGARRTAIFFVVSCAFSLGVELVGTGTGWPFGAYEYGELLGPKVLGRVPAAIPLSWFYVGLVSYLLAHGLLERWVGRATPVASVALGAFFLTVWDLALDPAMAHEGMPLRFWVWHEHGPYFGMPLQNFVGWAATAALFMGASRWLWGRDPDGIPTAFPLTVYALNLGFAAALDASVGLWGPIVLAASLGLAPLLLTRRRPVPQALPATVR
jgi:putative membrane protein